MAGNSFLQSPFQSLIDQPVKPLSGAQQVTEVDTPDFSDDAAPAPSPAPTPTPAPAAAPASLLPPENLRPLFEATASHFKVPVNVLMAIAQQESTYNPDAVNPASGAAGIGGYMGATAKSLGINPRDPNEAVPAIAQQLRERLDKGYDMADAVKEHFAGPDRKLWGEKTTAYGDEVLAKAGQIGQQLYGDTAAAPSPTPAFTPGTEQNQFAPNRMARADYEKEFRALNPKAGQAAVDNAMAQYDQQAAARTQAAGNRVQDKFATLQSPEAMFDARLNAKLQGPQNGVVPQLPERQQPAAFPETGTPDTAPEASTLDTIGGNLTGGALGTLVGAIAASAKLVGADDVAKEYSEGLDQIKARQKELGGDTMTGKVAGLVGGIVPALAGAPEYKVLEFAKNSGLFGIPAFQETYQAKLAEGQSNKLALVHAFEAFGMNTLAPMVMQHGMGAVIGKLGTEGAAGVKGAALGLGQAAGEGVAFSGANTIMDKGTDVLAGQQNDRPWIDPEDMAVQALGFSALRGAHMVGHAAGSMVEPAGPMSAAIEAAAPRVRTEPTLGDEATVDPAAVARAETVARAGGSVADQLRAIRPLDEQSAPEAPAGPLTAAVEHAADLHAIDPAPPPPEPAPEPPALDTLPMEDLRSRLRDVAQQVKAAADPAQRKELMGQRAEIEKAIAAVGKQAAADSKPAVEPLSAGPFDDMKAANRMMQRYAEETGQPHEVVGSDGKFKVQPIEGARDGIDTAGSGAGTDGLGRSGGTADAVGSDHAAGRAGTGTGAIEGERAGIDRATAQRSADAGDHRTGADGAADAKPALTNPRADIESITKEISHNEARKLVEGKTEKPGGVDPVRQIDAGEGNNSMLRMGEVPLSMFKQNEGGDLYDGTVNRKRAEAYRDRPAAGAPPVIAVLSPRTGKLNILDGGHRITAARMRGDATIQAIISLKSIKESTDVPQRQEVPEEAPPARGAEAEKPAAAGNRPAADIGTSAAPAAEGKLAARRALNDKQDAVVRAAAEKLAARKAEKEAADEASQAARSAGEEKTAAPEPAREVPKSFLKKVKVDHDVYIRDERRWETVKVPADKALASVREDIGNLEALLKCMR